MMSMVTKTVTMPEQQKEEKKNEKKRKEHATSDRHLFT